MSAALWAEGSKPTPGLTVVLDVKGASVSNQTLTEMKVEIRNILKETGLQVDFKFRTELLPEESFEGLILVQFKGRCEMDQQPVLFDERGPMALAYTHTIEGGILPFSTVLCDQLKTSIRVAMWGDQRCADWIVQPFIDGSGHSIPECGAIGSHWMRLLCHQTFTCDASPTIAIPSY